MSRKFVRTPPQHIAVDGVVAMTSKMFFNISEAARFVGTTAFWIEVMCREGRLPYRRAGQRIILRRDLVALMMSLTEERGLVVRTN